MKLDLGASDSPKGSRPHMVDHRYTKPNLQEVGTSSAHEHKDGCIRSAALSSKVNKTTLHETGPSKDRQKDKRLYSYALGVIARDG